MRRMSTGRRISWRWALWLVLPLLGGCLGPLFASPHQVFVANLNAAIGCRLNPHRVSVNGWADPNDLQGTTRLPNGLIAYTYAWIGLCTYTFDVDPKTDIVQAVGWAGPRNACGMSP